MNNSNFKEPYSNPDQDNQETKKKLREKKGINQTVIYPSWKEIFVFFNENNFPEIEARKFFNYFSSNGWLIGGKTPMVNWEAAAQNWMLNVEKFNQTQNTKYNRPKQLNTETIKDYSEPL